MKKIRSIPEMDSGATPQDSADEIAEDLLQQDVLPVDEGSLLTGFSEIEPEALTQTGRMDEPVGELGHRAPRQLPEDEVVIMEELVSDGINEADEELRELEPDDEEE